MGFFDLSVVHNCKSQKEALALKEKVIDTLLNDNYEEIEADDQKLIENYQPQKVLLKYNLSFHIEKNDLIVQGELQQTLILAILIIFAILFTYGIGVVLVVGYAYYQRVTASKALTQLIKDTQGTSFA